jgi:hypothetical protein
MWNQIKISKLDDNLVKGHRNSDVGMKFNVGSNQFHDNLATIRICDGIKCLHYN